MKSTISKMRAQKPHLHDPDSEKYARTHALVERLDFSKVASPSALNIGGGPGIFNARTKLKKLCPSIQH